jgi:hypothetical protein
MKDRYNAALHRIAAEANDSAPPANLEAALMREFDRTRRNRIVRPMIALLAAAAAIAAIWFVRLQPAATIGIAAPAPAAPWPTLVADRQPAMPRPARPVIEPERPFIPIPYVAPLDPYERVDVVRMQLPVSQLIAAGLRVDTDDAGASVQADVVVGQDGRARAFRLVSISNFNREEGRE